MKRSAILTLQFYRLLALYNIALTVLALSLIIFNGSTLNAATFLFAKIIGFIGAVSLHYFSAKENYFYFRNAGYGMRRIIISAFVFDFLCCLLLTVSIQTVTYAATHFKG